MVNNLLTDFLTIPRIAYFSMEIALQDAVPTYSGGLGVLAGDTIRSCVDLNIPVVAVTIISRKGYFHQTIQNSQQTEQPDNWQPEQYATPLTVKVAIRIAGHPVWVTAWLYQMRNPLQSCEPVLLLDTDLAENTPENRALTDHLYGGNQAYRLKQEMVLGIAGVKILQALGFKIWHYHMNEGHSALLALELLKHRSHRAQPLSSKQYDIAGVRAQCSFTTHTPIAAGHDEFPYDLADQLLGDYINKDILIQLAGKDGLSMTRLALNLSHTVNGVAKKHAEISRRLYPDYPIKAITNGVHPATWTAKSFAQLYDQYLPNWQYEPEILNRVDCYIPAESIWQAHYSAKQDLVAHIKSETGLIFDPAKPTLGFARRMTSYKRPDLLFSDIARLLRIAEKQPFQLVLAGKAHPHDEPGKLLIQRLHQIQQELANKLPIAFLPNYTMATALTMVAGVDVWLNTPMRPLEASGTSGMKAAFNGVPSLSVPDGWWLEGWIEGVTGWGIGQEAESDNANDAAALYNKLEQVVLPLYYQDRQQWIKIMQQTIAKNATFFNTHRMMRRYLAEVYILK